MRSERSEIASATSATGLTVGCTDSLLLDVPLRTFWPPSSQTFDLIPAEAAELDIVDMWRGSLLEHEYEFVPRPVQ